MSVLCGTILSDHIPVMVESDLQLAPDIEHGTFNDVRCKIDWLIKYIFTLGRPINFASNIIVQELKDCHVYVGI